MQTIPYGLQGDFPEFTKRVTSLTYTSVLLLLDDLVFVFILQDSPYGSISSY